MATPTAENWPPRRVSLQEVEEELSDDEPPEEYQLHFAPAGAWDFPLSRAEKVQRLFQLFEAELDVTRAMSTQAEEEEEEPAQPSKVKAEPIPPQVPVATVSLNPEISSCVSSSSQSSVKKNVSQGSGFGGPWNSSTSQTSSQSDLSGTISTQRCPQLRGGVGMSGSISAIVWGGGDTVRWIRFLPHNAIPGPMDADAQLHQLDDGEHVRAVRGRAAIVDGRLAEWLMLVTSKLRILTIGKSSKSSSPTFSFLAAPGHEICSILPGDLGAVCTVNQSRLHTLPPRPSQPSPYQVSPSLEAAVPKRGLCGSSQLSPRSSQFSPRSRQLSPRSRQLSPRSRNPLAVNEASRRQASTRGGFGSSASRWPN